MRIDDERLLAYLDGELPPEEAASVAAAIAEDSGLAARLEQHRRLRAVLHAHFDPLLEAPMPANILAMVRPGENVVPLKPRRSHALPRWGALAATLVAGIIGGTMLRPTGGEPVRVDDGRLIASAAIAHALDTQLAAAADAPVRIGLTFRDRQGAWCRSFTATAASGIGCRRDGKWQIEGLFPGAALTGGSYRMASSGDPRLMALADSLIAGAPVDARAERNARDKGWPQDLK